MTRPHDGLVWTVKSVSHINRRRVLEGYYHLCAASSLGNADLDLPAMQVRMCHIPVVFAPPTYCNASVLTLSPPYPLFISTATMQAVCSVELVYASVLCGDEYLLVRQASRLFQNMHHKLATSAASEIRSPRSGQQTAALSWAQIRTAELPRPWGPRNVITLPQ